MPGTVASSSQVEQKGAKGAAPTYVDLSPKPGATNKCVNVNDGAHDARQQWCNGERGTHEVIFGVLINESLPSGPLSITNMASVTSQTGSVTSNTAIVQFGGQAIPVLSCAGVAVITILLGLAGVVVTRRLLP